MKTANEISEMLSEELLNHVHRINDKFNSRYYNKVLGDTSFLLAGLLHVLLKNSGQIDIVWIDDSLISKVQQTNNTIFINGIMIWGRQNTTEQWVDPFNFILNIDKNSKNFIGYSFFFKDANLNEISYEEFRENRDYYSHEIKNWKYEFNYKKDNSYT